MTQKNNVVNAGLFEGRHKWPSIVTDYIYKEKDGGYDPRNFKLFEIIATTKMLKWKNEGIKIVNLYLSGLIGATIAALNAAFNVGIYIKLFHYSNIIDNWVQQDIDFIPKPLGIIIKTTEEIELELKEQQIKDEISKKERHLLISYTEIFNKLYQNYDPDRFTWDTVYNYIIREYINANKDLVALMKPYFDNYCERKEQKPYADVLREKLNSDRRYLQEAKPIYKLANKRASRRRNY